MKQVLVIGSGNAFNIDGRAHAAYLLESSSGEVCLLDCGATTLSRLHQLNLSCASIDSILLTHFHGDHYGGLPFLLLQMSMIERRQKSLHISGPAGVQTACDTLVHAMYPGLEFSFPIHYHEIYAKVACEPLFAKSSIQVEAIAMDHKAESLGYRLFGPESRSFAFSGDCALNQNVLDLVCEMDLAIVELTMFKQSIPPVSHIALSEVLERRTEFEARKLVWSHIHDALARAAEEEGLEVAFDGMLLKI